MTLELRPYQLDAVGALYGYFEKHDGNPLIVLPTGTGKSLVIADFIKGVLSVWPDQRFLVLTHVKELISQDFGELLRLWPEAPAGVYSAGLGRRDLNAQILFAGIQSIHSKAYKMDRVDLVLIDEAHLIPRKTNTLYRRFLNDLLTINNSTKICGFTATPYRMDSGMLHDGDEAIFSTIAFEYDIATAIREGYLCEVVSQETDTQLDTALVSTRGGEFVPAELEAAVDVDPVNQAAVLEILTAGKNRGSWLVFCSGVKHTMHVAALLGQHVPTATILGNTPDEVRDQSIAAFKSGQIRCLVGANVLTTGFNAPSVDLIAMLRPTKSVGLYIQMVGRGTRLANGKSDALVLDFAGNVRRHGPIDRINARKPKGAGGDAPVKKCPECKALHHTSVRICSCGYHFPEPKPELSARPSQAPLLSSQIKPERVEVDHVSYRRHEKPEKPPSLRVQYHCGYLVHSEWVCFEHTGYPRQKAEQWWSRRKPGVPAPRTVADALAASAALPAPTTITIKPSGKYTEIVNVSFT